MNDQAGADEVRVDALNRVVIAAAPTEPDELHVRMPREQSDELRAAVPGGANDPHLDPAWPAGRVEPTLGSGQAASRGERMDRSHDGMTIQEQCILMQPISNSRDRISN